MNEELQVLCEAVIEGSATPEQLRRLEELVLADAEARRFYVEYLHQHGSLQWSAAEPELLPPALANRQRELPGDQAAPLPGSFRSRFAVKEGCRGQAGPGAITPQIVRMIQTCPGGS